MKVPGLKKFKTVTVFQLGLFVLSIIVLVMLLVSAVTRLNPEVERIFQIFDFFACLIFFGDFLSRFFKAENKTAFFKWGWIELLACIPAIDILRAGRLLQVLPLLGLMRSLGSRYALMAEIKKHKHQSIFSSVFLTTVILVTASSSAILIAEVVPESNIRSAEDAIWWSVTTMTTVGYGDKYPVTTGGRIIAMALMVCGVGLFGTLSGAFASVLLGPGAGLVDQRAVLAQLKILEEKVESLEAGKSLAREQHQKNPE